MIPTARSALPWIDFRRVLAIRLDNIGDVVMLTPSLKAIREACPRARITLMASPAGAKVAPMLPWVDDVFELRSVWQDVSGALPFDPERERALASRLRSNAYDAAVVFTSFLQSAHPPAFVCRSAGVPVRLGQSKESGDALTHRVPPLPDRAHQSERSLHLLEQTGVPVASRHLSLAVPGDAAACAAHTLESAGVRGGYFVIAPGASCPARRYPRERFAEAARMIEERTGLPGVVVGSDKERDEAEMLLERARAPRRRALVGNTVPEMAALIRGARLLLANNSGPMHLADAVHTPMVVLYSGTEWLEQWRPRSAPARLLRREVNCSPCFAFRCPFDHECLDVPAEAVLSASLEMLASGGGE